LCHVLEHRTPFEKKTGWSKSYRNKDKEQGAIKSQGDPKPNQSLFIQFGFQTDFLFGFA
jgi:hypothetical protein